MGSLSKRLAAWTARHHKLIGRIAFELVIVFVGVSAAFALENARANREEGRYRVQMVSALRASLDDYAVHGKEIEKQIETLLQEFRVAREQTGRAPLPIYRESGGERPPTRAWDGIVETGAARALEPMLFFRLARFYGRVDSIGDRYIRYNIFSEERVLPFYRQPDTFYDEGDTLKPEYAAYVDRLQDLQREHRATVLEAAELRDALR